MKKLLVELGKILCKDPEFVSLMERLAEKNKEGASVLSASPLALKAASRSLELFFEIQGPKQFEDQGFDGKQVAINSVKASANMVNKGAFLPTLMCYLGKEFSPENFPSLDELKALMKEHPFVRGITTYHYVLRNFFEYNVQIEAQEIINRLGAKDLFE